MSFLPHRIHVSTLQMDAIQQERTRTGILRAIRTLATHHRELVMQKLLHMELPLSANGVDSWQSLAADASIADALFTGVEHACGGVCLG